MSQVCHADFFPLPRKAETTSQLVKAWTNVIPLPFSGPTERYSSCTGIHLIFLPWTNATHSCCRPIAWRVGIALIAMTRMSVSLAFTNIDLLPSCAACLACTKIRVSASSWLQGDTPSRLIVWLLSTFSSLVTITVLGDGICSILSARKLNRSVLLSLSRKKLRQFEGTLHLLVTLRLAPCPRFDLASSFRLDGRYTSHTMSVLSYLMEYARIVGMTSNVVYSSNVFGDRGGDCSLVLNHQWWWHQPVVHYQGV